MWILRTIVRKTFWIYMNIFNKMDMIDKNNIPKDGAYVICSNHVHWLDPLVYVGGIDRMTFAIAKEELFSSKIKNFIMRKLGTIPVTREVMGDNKKSISEAVQRLKEGNLLLIYPEGTRFGLKKGIKPKKGVALIALEARVPIIPMAIVGSFKPFTKIRCKIGKPIDISEYYPKEGENVNLRNLVKITNDVMDNIIKIRDEINTEEIELQMNKAEEKREKKKALKNKNASLDSKDGGQK